MTVEEFERRYKAAVLRSFEVSLYDGTVPYKTYEKRYNPYHDPSNGRFTSGGGGGGGYLFVGRGEKGKGQYVFDRDIDAEYEEWKKGRNESNFADNDNALSNANKLEKHDIDDCYNTTNPNYYKSEVYQRNCQRCVSAYEARRRGYDVEASERILGSGTSDDLTYMTDKNGWPSVYKDGHQNLRQNRKGTLFRKHL